MVSELLVLTKSKQSSDNSSSQRLGDFNELSLKPKDISSQSSLLAIIVSNAQSGHSKTVAL